MGVVASNVMAPPDLWRVRLAPIVDFGWLAVRPCLGGAVVLAIFAWLERKPSRGIIIFSGVYGVAAGIVGIALSLLVDVYPAQPVAIIGVAALTLGLYWLRRRYQV